MKKNRRRPPLSQGRSTSIRKWLGALSEVHFTTHW
nr:MAG TPA: hypothetical protein [Bacteriophage sp.]